MKKIVLISVAILVLSAGVVFAQMGRDGGMMGNRGYMMNRNWTNMPMMSGMMGGMMGNNIVATSDGGVVVVSYNRLYKFDKNLNLVKRADIPFDKEYIQHMMQNYRGMGMMWRGSKESTSGSKK